MKHLVTFRGNGLPTHPTSTVAWETGETDFARFDRVYVCGKCGEIWAKWEQEGAMHYCALINACCEGHRTWQLQRPCSLLYNVQEDIALLPPALLIREFWLGDKENLELCLK